MNHPFFSIIIPTYNRAHLIIGVIKSILKQTYSSYEIIIVDDGSTDNTQAVVQPFLNNHIHYFKKENGERAAARNFGTGKATGDYIEWFDSDDLMLPNHLEEAVMMVEKYLNPAIFALSFIIIKQDFSTVRKMILPVPSCNNFLYQQNFLACNTVFVRRDIALHFPFNEDRALSACEDYELWLRIAAQHVIYTSANITSQLVEHTARSVNVATPSEAITQKFELFLKYVLSNEKVVAFLDGKKNNFVARVYLQAAIALGVNKNKKGSIRYFLKAMATFPRLMLQRQWYVYFNVLFFYKSK